MIDESKNVKRRYYNNKRASCLEGKLPEGKSFLPGGEKLWLKLSRIAAICVAEAINTFILTLCFLQKYIEAKIITVVYFVDIIRAV